MLNATTNHNYALIIMTNLRIVLISCLFFFLFCIGRGKHGTKAPKCESLLLNSFKAKAMLVVIISLNWWVLTDIILHIYLKIVYVLRATLYLFMHSLLCLIFPHLIIFMHCVRTHDSLFWSWCMDGKKICQL